MQNAKCKMKNEKQNLSERLLEYAVNSIKLTNKFSKDITGKYIVSQYIRSSTSAGANYEEACGAESKADFIHKMQIVLKELRESAYWLKLVFRTGISKSENLRLHYKRDG